MILEVVGIVVLGLFIVVFGTLLVVMTVDMVRLKSYIPPVPTSDPAIREIFNIVKRYARPGMEVHDLGCGDGRILSRLSRQFPDAHYIGYEKALLPRLIGRLWYFHSRKQNVNLYVADLFTADLSGADIVIAYLFPNVMDRFEEKIQNELKKGAVVISVGFQLPTRADHKVVHVQPGILLTSRELYIYAF